MSQALNLFEKIDLENGLELNLYDGSKKIAGDRWYLSLIAKVEISVENALLKRAELEIPAPELILTALGPIVFFEKKLDRNFVDSDKRDAAFQSLRDSFIDSVAKYLSHPDFPAKLILKRYNEHLEKQKWYV
jgi:hypothetical protein